MVSILTTLALIIVLFFTGKIFESVKRFVVLLLDIFFKILNLLGCQINLMEPKVRVSKEFKNTFGDIRIVKKSKHNNKIIPSVNKFALIILVVSIFLVVSNFMHNGWISEFLYNNGFLNFMIKSQENMETTFVALMFSVISFSLAKIISQWKETKKYRIAKKEMCTKNKVLSTMTSKQLLDAAKEKDAQRVRDLSLEQLQEQEQE